MTNTIQRWIRAAYADMRIYPAPCLEVRSCGCLHDPILMPLSHGEVLPRRRCVACSDGQSKHDEGVWQWLLYAGDTGPRVGPFCSNDCLELFRGFTWDSDEIQTLIYGSLGRAGWARSFKRSAADTTGKFVLDFETGLFREVSP